MTITLYIVMEDPETSSGEPVQAFLSEEEAEDFADTDPNYTVASCDFKLDD